MGPGRSGDEPRTARSPLRLRLALALVGAVTGATAAAVTVVQDRPAWAVFFGAVALLATVNVAVVRHRMRQGPRWQPGPATPPYLPAAGPGPATPSLGRPLPRPRPAGPPRRPVAQRRRAYLVLMGACVLLILLAWTWVQAWSVALATAMTLVAMAIPPVAALVANAGHGRRREQRRR